MTIQQHASFDSSAAELNATSKLVKAWESKNAKNAAKAGGISMMALSLAACGGSSTTTTTTTTTDTATTAASTMTLTSGIDSAAGGAGNDTINAGLDSGGNQTLTSLDSISGGAGTDTMNVVMKANATPASTAVEKFVVSTSAAATLDMLGSTGVTSITNQASTNTLTVSNITGDVALTLSSTDQGGTFNFDTAGALAAQTVNVSSVTGGTLTVGTTGAVTLSSQGAANTVTLSSSATSLKVTGAENLTLAGTTAQTTVDASGATGTFAMTSDGTKAVSITGSAGADTITMTGSNALTDTISLGAGADKVTFTANLADADIVDGGDGTDTVVGTSANLAALTSAATTSNLTNFEVVQVSNQSGADLDVSDIQEDGITTVNLAHSGANLASGARQITGEAGSLTVNLGKSAAGNTGALGGTLTVTDGADAVATDDSVTINNTAVNSTTGANLNLNAALTSTGYENVTFNTGAGSGNTEQTIGTITVTADAATAATTLTLKGGNAIDVGTQVTTNSTAGITVDGSGLTAQAAGTTSMDLDTVAAGAGATVTITGSEGDDIFGESTAGVNTTLATTINAGAGADSIFTGAGADTINGGAGKDAINSGAGNDTIDGGADDDTIDMSGNLTNADVIDGGEGTDTLTVSNTDVTTVAAYSLGQIATLNGNISNIEELNFGTTLAQTIDVGRLDNISIATIANLAGASGLSGLAAANDVTITATTGQTLSLALADATGAADVVNVNLKASAVVNGNTITINGVETVNIAGTDAAAANVSAINVLALASDTATSVVVTGNDGLALTSTAATKITSFDASAVAANDSSDTAANMAVTYTSANTSATASVTIKGGAGNDVLEGNAGHDTIEGGAGTDQITATAGNDTVSGGAGADTLVITAALFAANSTAANTSTFDGGAGTDILSVGNTATIVDADFDGITSFETLTTGNGTNSYTLGAKADAAGIVTINGGTGADTIDTSDVDFDNVVSIDAGLTADVITGGAGKEILVIGAVLDSYIVNDNTVHVEHDTFAVNVGDEVDWSVADIAVVEAAKVAETSVVDTNGDDLITSLNTAFTGADDAVANIEAMIIHYTGGEHFLVIDVDADQGIDASDVVIQLTGTITGLTLTDGDAIIA